MYPYAIRLVSGQLKNMLLAATICGLIAMNIATLVSDSFHTSAFTVLGTALGYTLGSKLAEEVLERSPSIKRKNDVASVTHELSKKNQVLQQQNDKLNKTIEKKSEAIKRFSQRIATRSAIATTRNLSSLTGEAHSDVRNSSYSCGYSQECSRYL